MLSSSKKNGIFSVTRYLLVLDMLVWIGFAFLTLYQNRGIEKMPYSSVLMAVMMIGNALIFGLCAWKFTQRKFKITCMVWLLVNIVLTFTDQFGIFDLVTLILDIIILGFVFLQSFRECGGFFKGVGLPVYFSC